MTLATKFYITTPVPVERLWERLDGIVNPRRSVKPSKVDRFPGGIHNESGQGNKSMLFIDYGIDGPIPASPPKVEDGEEYQHEPPADHMVKARLDTAYGFRTGGFSCDDLHAAIILAAYDLAAEFSPDAQVGFHHEYSGVWYDSILDLSVLSGRAVEALAYFDSDQFAVDVTLEVA